MARLDRLSSAKEIAQTGAVIGREFSHELLSQIAGLHAERLDDALEDLIESGLVFRHGGKPDAIFEFKHALIRDVAYESLLKSKRREIHGRIAKALEKSLPGLGENALELVAHHFEGAGNLEAAIEYWYKAGQSGAKHSAYQEAIAHCERGVKLLESLSDPESRRTWELDLHWGLVLTDSRVLVAYCVCGVFPRPRSGERTRRAHQTVYSDLGRVDVSTTSRSDRECAQNGR